MSSNVTPTTTPVKTTGLHVGDAGPGCRKVDPILIADSVKRTFGGLPLRHPGLFDLVTDPFWYRLRSVWERLPGR